MHPENPDDNTLTDMERFKDPNLFKLSRRVRKLSRRVAQMERNWRNFIRDEVPGFSRTGAVATLRKELDATKKDLKALQGKFWGAVGAIALMLIKWLLDQVHK